MGQQLFSQDLLDAADVATLVDLDIYVDGAAGSDTTGDGTAALPYATITKAHSMVPYILRHVVHIHIVTAGAYTDFPATVDHKYENGGALSFDATSCMADVDAGPYTIDAGGVALLDGSYCADLTIAGGGLTPAAWDGKLILFLTGTIAGCLCGVVENTATVVRMSAGYTAPAAGDTFKIVEPGAVVTLPAQITTFKGDSSNDNPLGIFGLELAASEPTVFDTGYVSTVGSILNLDQTDLYDCTMIGQYGAGASAAAADIMDVPAFVDFWNGMGILSSSGAYITLHGSTVLAGMQSLDGVDLYDGAPAIIGGAITNVAGYCVDCYARAATAMVWSLYVKAKTTENAVSVVNAGFIDVAGLYVEQGKSGVHAGPMMCGAVMYLYGKDADVTNAILMGQGARLAIEAASCSLAGASGAGHQIKWESGGADSAYPVANAEVNDALGGQVVGF